MGFFSRDKEAIETGPPADVPFQSLRRTPRNTRTARANRDSQFDAPPPLDPAQTAKTRARRRLIGAIALALAAVVFVPMLFDRTPVGSTDDLALQIPDRDTPFEGRRGVPDVTRAPLKASPQLPAAAAPAVVAPPTVQPAPPAEDRPAEKVADKPADKPEPDAATKPVDKPVPKAAIAAVPDKPKSATPPSPTDDPKALAALEGRPDAAASDAGGRTYAVQIAAFSAADKARGLRDQLVAGGLKSYTESVATPQGLRTRVRLGPFASRDAADRAKEKLKTMKLDGSVVPL